MEKEKSKVSKVMIVSEDKEKGVSYTPFIIEDTSKIKSISCGFTILRFSSFTVKILYAPTTNSSKDFIKVNSV